ncbi:MAG: hypothetical protein LKF87_03805 [Clostridium tyrobutyricum]|jgi:hypothetical protein|uniref:hypothetical protein n=1 Tax=Clostridium tyrobutyricum TaxID=1519 RepID=UPI001C394862|nr:hypothetical protein [Clostridium tyrobutyricum]MBV4447442.1 hypothetical protein [Clostridium tyrobutyricum]MCH4199272.1 hypothetical protein [Clostridium tyrobutyricum]MCH4236604.1 hypothetical protein [Clostridium tyrobutyricum]MCH4258080.1 hypothetical protein [Clostridium tyrobutyricum]MCI1239119.1 hypothetical protein [Clostridium tyrobutyricum]
MSFSDKALDLINRKNARLYALADNWAKSLENEAKADAPWKDRTAHARQGIHCDATMNNNQITISLSHGVEYGGILEDGSKPHIIRPKDKKALYWKGADHPVKLVHHPGTKKYATVGPTMERNKYKIRDDVIKSWEE